MKTLGASMFIMNGEKFDYCYKETIASMNEFADSIAVVDAGSDDGTAEILRELQVKYPKMKLLCLPRSEWETQKGQTKLSYFSNIAHDLLETDYFINVQADEIPAESSYEPMRRAIETGHEAFLVSRINLWKDCYHQLNVPQHRKPVSTEVIRLAKRGYHSYDDAESLQVPSVNFDFVNEIKLIHYGFVRSKEVHADKVRHMLTQIFLMDADPKLEGMTTFDGTKWFSDDDLIPFKEQHPKVMSEWVATRP